MKKILCLIIFLPFLCISCSDNNDPSAEEEKKPEVELPFDEPLFMFGSSMEEVRKAETRKEGSRRGDEVGENELCYKEDKDGFVYSISYSFYNDKMFAISVETNVDYISAPDFLNNSLAEKYGEGTNGLYCHDAYLIRNYGSAYLIYLPVSPIEGVPFYAGEPIINEPLFMLGSSLEEVRKAETREETGICPTYGGEGSVLSYKEQKNGLSYEISYTFKNDKLTLMVIEFAGKHHPIGISDLIRFSFANKYEYLRTGMQYQHGIYHIMCSSNAGTPYISYEKGPIYY